VPHMLIDKAPSVGDHENARMHDLMIHLRDEPQARHSVVHGVLDMWNVHSSVQLLILTTNCVSVATSI
jgi:hypothetical protein